MALGVGYGVTHQDAHTHAQTCTPQGPPPREDPWLFRRWRADARFPALTPLPTPTPATYPPLTLQLPPFGQGPVYPHLSQGHSQGHSQGRALTGWASWRDGDPAARGLCTPSPTHHVLSWSREDRPPEPRMGPWLTLSPSQWPQPNQGGRGGSTVGAPSGQRPEHSREAPIVQQWWVEQEVGPGPRPLNLQAVGNEMTVPLAPSSGPAVAVRTAWSWPRPHLPSHPH